MVLRFGVGDRFLAILLLSLVIYKLTNFTILLIFLISTLITWIWYEYEQKQYWHKLGVPGPMGNIFFGSLLDVAIKGVAEYDQRNLQKYGHSFGSYLFGRRNFTTMDLEMMRRIFIKDFSHFQNRFGFIDTDNENMQNTVFRNAITMKKNQEWKRIRNRVTPAFTSGKMKKVLPTLNECTNRLCEHIEAEYNAKAKELPLKDVFGRLVLEEIARGGFSLDVNTFKSGEEHIFVQKVKEAFGTKWRQYFLFLLPFCPGLLHFLETYLNYDAFQNSAEPFFRSLLEGLYDQRKADAQANEKYKDIFQILMNAVDEGAGGDDNATDEPIDADIFHKELQESAQSNKHLTKLELVAQSFVFLVAGYETTGSTLHFIIYMLSMLPEIQERLREEIHAVIGDEKDEGEDGGEVTFDHLRRMPYLKAVVQETLRMYPIAPTMNRECNEDIVVNGVQFRRGDLVSMPIYAIHHSEEFYEEPEKFDPERFMPDQKAARDPITFLTFGLGPRNCIGMRFAEFQMHVALAILVRRFRFFPGPNTPKLPLKIRSSDMLRPEKPLLVMAEKI